MPLELDHALRKFNATRAPSKAKVFANEGSSEGLGFMFKQTI